MITSLRAFATGVRELKIRFKVGKKYWDLETYRKS